MELIRSNRTEHLADALASRIGASPLGPFNEEIIVVQSRGMERWLTLALADRLGILAKPVFPFPRAVIERALEGLGLGGSDEARRYDPERLTWTIAEVLRDAPPDALRSYLGEPGNPDRSLRLAGSIARAFDDYVVYRPDLLLGWARSDRGDWQGELWRRLTKRLGPHDLASRINQGLAALRNGASIAEHGLKRLQLFSLETLPPLFLELFSELSKSIPTTFYLLEPSREYLGDLFRVEKPNGSGDEPRVDGHPLVATLGRLAVDFQQLLLEVEPSVELDDDLFVSPPQTDLLRSLQADVLALRPPPKKADRVALDDADRSIALHQCTGAMREAQVLHDLILGALEDDPTLAPEDVVIMTPDLDTYAPAFRAVFGRDDEHRIPYAVHDRRTRDDASFYEDFMTALAVLDSRFTVLDLLRLIEADSLKPSFRFTADERARITNLLEASGIRWGIDEEHRAELELPAEPLHTWRAGLGRLFLGFASPPDSNEVFRESLPKGAASLGDAELVGRLSALCEVLFAFQKRARKDMPVVEWVHELQMLATELLAEDDERSEGARVLRASLSELRERVEAGGFRGAIGLETIRRELGPILEKRAPAVGFLQRGVSITELVPLRSIPFRIVCLAGMSEDTFPRADRRPSFDLMRESHRRGDRSRRDDDRHSFLQAILCARDRLILTYSAAPGTAPEDAIPAPVVWELQETTRRYYVSGSGAAVFETTRHPIHPFDTRYFQESNLPRSASQRYLEVARALDAPSSAAPGVVLRAESEAGEPELPVTELADWLWRPTHAFVREILRARFGSRAVYEPAETLTDINLLQQASVGRAVQRAGLRGAPLDAYLGASPEFPEGAWGELQRRRISRELGVIDRTETSFEIGQERRSQSVRLELDGITLEGRLDGLCANQRIVKRFDRPGKREELTVWIEHLLMHCEAGLPKTTRLVLRDSETRPSLVTFEPVDGAQSMLRTLLDLYRASRNAPTLLFEVASRRFADTIAKHDLKRAQQAAKVELSKLRKRSPSLRYALGDRDVFADEDWFEAFAAAAQTVYEPLLAHRSEGWP